MVFQHFESPFGLDIELAVILVYYFQVMINITVDVGYGLSRDLNGRISLDVSIRLMK